MKVMGFEHIFEKAVQFKLKPGGNLEKKFFSLLRRSLMSIFFLFGSSLFLCPTPHPPQQIWF